MATLKLPRFECIETAQTTAADYPDAEEVDTRRSIYCAFSACAEDRQPHCGECMLERGNDSAAFEAWEGGAA